MKQANLNWFKTLDNFLTSIGIEKLKSKLGKYVLRGTNNQILKAVLAWVDDITLFGDDDGRIER